MEKCSLDKMIENLLFCEVYFDYFRKRVKARGIACLLEEFGDLEDYDTHLNAAYKYLRLFNFLAYWTERNVKCTVVEKRKEYGKRLFT